MQQEKLMKHVLTDFFNAQLLQIGALNGFVEIGHACIVMFPMMNLTSAVLRIRTRESSCGLVTLSGKNAR